MYGGLPRAALEVLTYVRVMLHPPVSALLLPFINRINQLWPMHFPMGQVQAHRNRVLNMS